MPQPFRSGDVRAPHAKRRGPILGVVACGGASIRMGHDKALIHLDGEPLVVRAARTLAEHTSEVALASGKPTRFGDVSALSGLHEIADAPAPGEGRRPGPLAALVAALEHAARRGFGGVLFVACDLVHVGSEALVPLARALQEGTDVALWVRDGLPEPLCAAYSVECAPVARAAFDRGARRMVEPWEGSALHVAQSDAPHDVAAQLENVNTPEDGVRLGLALSAGELARSEVTP